MRILFFSESVTLAHVTRPWVLARALDPKVYDVHFACSNEFEFVFSKLGNTSDNITKWSLNSISSSQFLKALATGSRIYNKETLRKYIEEDLYLINKINPDVVIGDFRISLAISARMCGVPYVSITNAYWSPYTNQDFPLPQHPLTGILGVKITQLFYKLVMPFFFKHHATPLNQLAKANNLPVPGSLLSVYTEADHVLYADVPELINTVNRPENHHYIGPLLWSPSIPLPDWFEQLDKNKKIVYLTLGSSGVSGLLPNIVQTLSQLGVTVVVSTAGQECIEFDSNVYTTDFLPAERIIPECALVVCNGGSATAYQALQFGVPVLGIAANMDQHLTMKYLEKFGAGLLLRSEHAHKTKLVKNAINTLFSNVSFKINAKKISEIFKQREATSQFIGILNQVVKQSA